MQYTKGNNERAAKLFYCKSLEKHPMIGGDLATREPTRMLMGILSKFMDPQKIIEIASQYYTPQDSELILKPQSQNFNCIETSSCGRVLDAAAAL